MKKEIEVSKSLPLINKTELQKKYSDDKEEANNKLSTKPSGLVPEAELVINYNVTRWKWKAPATTWNKKRNDLAQGDEERPK